MDKCVWRTVTTNTDVTTNIPPTTNVTVVTNYVLKDNFIDLDPDRFKVRVTDVSKTGAGYVDIDLFTVSIDSETIDNPTWLQLNEQPADSGVFISTNQLLVSDDIDDDFSNSQVPADEGFNDRTHKIALGGQVMVQYEPEEDTWMQTEIPVNKEKMVHIIPVILRDDTGGQAVVTVNQAAEFFNLACQRFAQVGVGITWSSPVVCDPPTGVDLSDGLTVRYANDSTNLADEAKALISGLGTAGNPDDIHVFFVTRVKAGDHLKAGSAVANYYYMGTEDQPYWYNAFLSSNSCPDRLGYGVAHELAHLLGVSHHATETWRLMHPSIVLDGIKGSRRLSSEEETSIKGDTQHVQ